MEMQFQIIASNFSDIQIRNLAYRDYKFRMNVGLTLISASESQRRTSFRLQHLYSPVSQQIGVEATTIADPILIEKPVLFRTNIDDALTMGIEGLVQKEIWNDEAQSIDLMVSASIMRGRYSNGKEVENVPNVTVRSSLTYKSSKTKAQIQWNLVGSQYSDATNSTYTPNAIYGEIPLYHVLDLSVNHRLGKLMSLGLKLNNVLNTALYSPYYWLSGSCNSF